MKVQLVVLRASDIATGDSESPVALYTDPDIAALVAEGLNASPRKVRLGVHGTFEVIQFELCQAVSENRVPGEINRILRRYSP